MRTNTRPTIWGIVILATLARLAFGQVGQLPQQVISPPPGTGTVPATVVNTGTTYTIGGTLPAASGTTGQTLLVTNGATGADCTTGGGTVSVLCRSNGTTYIALPSSSGPASAGGSNGQIQFNSSGALAGVTLVPIANGGTGTASPAIVPGTNVTVSGSWPNQTINATGGTSGAAGGRYTYVCTGSGNEATAIVTAMNANPTSELYLQGTCTANFAAGTGSTSIPTTGRIIGLPLTSIIKQNSAGSPIIALNASQNNIIIEGVTLDGGGNTMGGFTGILSISGSTNVKFQHGAIISSTTPTGAGTYAVYLKDDQGNVIEDNDISGGYSHLIARQISGQVTLTNQDVIRFNRLHDNGLSIGTTSQVGGNGVYVWQNGTVGLTQTVTTAAYTPTVQDASFITTFSNATTATTITIPTVGNGANQTSGGYAKGWGIRGVVPLTAVTATITPTVIATATVSSSTTGAGPTFTVSAAMTQQVATGKGVVFATALGCGIATGIFPITLISTTTFSVAGVTSSSSCAGTVTFQDLINGAQTVSYAPGTAFQVYTQDGLTLQASILTAISANYTVSTADEASVIASSAAGATTINLPNPASLALSPSAFGPGGYLSIVNNGTGTITFTSSATIQGTTTLVGTGLASVSTYIYTDGFNWQITSHNGAYSFGWKPYLSGETLVEGNHAWNIAHTYNATGGDGNCYHTFQTSGAKFVDNTCGMDPNLATTLNRGYASEYSCLRATSASEFTFKGNHCYRPGETGIFVEFGSFNGLISDNTVMSSATTCIIANGNYDPELGGQTYTPFGGTVIVTGNNLKNCGKVGIQTEGNSIIANNFIDGAHGLGVQISTSGAKAVNVLVADNNIIDSTNGGVTNYAGVGLAAVANAFGITIQGNKVNLPGAVIPIIGQTSSSSANPTVLTLPSSATVVNGNTYSFQNLVGNTAPNGNSYVVTVVDQNHISIPVAATGVATVGGAMTAAVNVPEVATVNVSGQVVSSYLSNGAMIGGETVRDQTVLFNQLGGPVAGTRVFVSNASQFGNGSVSGTGATCIYNLSLWSCGNNPQSGTFVPASTSGTVLLSPDGALTQYLVPTAAVTTLTFPNGTYDSERVCVVVKQGGTGFAVSGASANTAGFFTPGTTANLRSQQCLKWSSTLTLWLEESLGATNF